jgi:hypothetical protein
MTKYFLLLLCVFFLSLGLGGCASQQISKGAGGSDDKSLSEKKKAQGNQSVSKKQEKGDLQKDSSHVTDSSEFSEDFPPSDSLNPNSSANVPIQEDKENANTPSSDDNSSISEPVIVKELSPFREQEKSQKSREGNQTELTTEVTDSALTKGIGHLKDLAEDLKEGPEKEEVIHINSKNQDIGSEERTSKGAGELLSVAKKDSEKSEKLLEDAKAIGMDEQKQEGKLGLGGEKDSETPIEDPFVEQSSFKKSNKEISENSSNTKRAVAEDSSLKDAFLKDMEYFPKQTTLNPFKPSVNHSKSPTLYLSKNKDQNMNLPSATRSTKDNQALFMQKEGTEAQEVEVLELQKVFSETPSLEQKGRRDFDDVLTVGLSDLPIGAKKGNEISSLQKLSFGEKDAMISTDIENTSNGSRVSPKKSLQDYGNLRDYLSAGKRELDQTKNSESRDYQKLQKWALVDVDLNQSKISKESETKQFNRAVEWIKKKGRMQEVE